MPSFEYNFPAIRGIQAGREYYISMCPLRLIPRIFLFDEDELNPELRAQRILNKSRIPEMARYILANPQVALVVDHYEEQWGRLWYILVTGHAELLEQGEEGVEAIGLLREKYQQYRDMAIDRNPVIKIVPARAISWGI